METRFLSSIWFFAFLTLALSISIPNGYNYGTAFVFILSFCLIFIKNEKILLFQEDKVLIASFFTYAFSIFIALYINEGNIKDLDRPSRFILVIPVIILFLNVKNQKQWLWVGSCVGAFCAFLLAMYEKGVLGMDRAHGSENPIMFGNVGLLLGLLNFSAALYFISSKKFSFALASIICALLGIGVSVLSGSRGGWIAIPIIGFFILWQSKSIIGKRNVFYVFFISIILFFVVIITPQTGVKNRINLAVENLIEYNNGEKINTSIGLRIDMWKAGLIMFQESPLFGVGNSGSEAVKIKLIEKGVVSKAIQKYTHAHNEYIEALSKRGIIGVMFLLLVYLVPLKLFLSKMKQYPNNWKIKSYAMAGALIPMAYMDFSLTQVMFGHNIGVMMYVFPIAFFWAATRWAEREERELGNIA